MLLPCASVETFVYSVCACSRTYGASSRELGERHASCDIIVYLLLQQLRLLRVLLRTAVAAVAAVAVSCRGFSKVGLPEASKIHYEIQWVSRQIAYFWAFRAEVRIYLESSLTFLFLCLFFAYSKTHTIFFLVSVI